MWRRLCGVKGNDDGYVVNTMDVDVDVDVDVLSNTLLFQTQAVLPVCSLLKGSPKLAAV